jgi:hypothetical protein
MTRLTTEKKKSELKRHRDIILTTIDYILQRIEDDLARDHSSAIAEHFQKQKQLTQKYYQSGRLDRLQQKLQSLTAFPRQQADLIFANYINEKTGYDIDIFENMRSCVDTIIQQNKIKNKKDLDDVSIMFEVYKQHPVDQNKVDILRNLLIEFGKRPGRQNSSSQVTIKYIDRSQM